MSYFQVKPRSFGGILILAVLLILPLSPARATGSASISGISPGTTIDVGSSIDFSVNTSGFTNPIYQISDSFPGTSVTSGDFSSAAGYFGWTPIASDVGTHNITFTISDMYGDSTSVTQTINVNQAGTPALSVQDVSPGSTVGVGQTVSFLSLAASFPEEPSYSVSDNFSGTSVTENDISQSGYFSWTPTTNDIGTHTLTITAEDPNGDTETTQQILTVTNTSNTTTTSSSPISLSIESLSTANAAVGEPVTFDAVASGFSSPNYTLSDSFSGSTISNADINSSGDFSWTPSAADIGTHTITVNVADSLGHASTITQTITVQSAGVVIQNISPSTSVPAETPLTFSVSTPNLAVVTYNLSDTFGGSTVANADISSAGNFSWTPSANDVGSHTLTITGRSNTGSTVSTTLQISVLPVGSAVPTTTTSTKPTYDFTTTLAPGDQSQAVTDLQTFLTDYGLYSGPITGYFGALTQSAIESFQTAHGISAIGTVGPLTLAALNQLETTTPATTATTTTASTTTGTNAYQFTTELMLGSTGDAVTALQNKLTSLGDYSGPVTGYYGSLTQAAVEKFQTANTISAVGYVGPATRAALNS